MAVTANISRKLDNNCVQVDISSKKIWTRYFKVPENKADSFIANYKKQDTRNNWRSNLMMLTGALAGCFIASIFTQKLSKGIKTAIGILAGLLGTAGAIFTNATIVRKQEDKLLKNYNAEEIFYESKKFPI